MVWVCLKIYRQVEIQEQGKLDVTGGRAKQPPPEFEYDLGGGAGGVIQIISPEGSLARRTLSLVYGLYSGICADPLDAEGFLHLPGI